MIEYIIPANPDDRVLLKASQILKKGGMICLPTDTSWIVLIDPYVKDAITKIHQLKGEQKNKHFSLLCSNISMASEIAVITDSAFRHIRNKIPGHYTFIFESTKKLSKAIKASKTDKEVGLRFVPIHYVQKLLEVHGQVLTSTNLTTSMLGLSEDEDIYSYQIEDFFSNRISLIIDPGEYSFKGPSTIYRFIKDEAELVREGAGPLI